LLVSLFIVFVYIALIPVVGFPQGEGISPGEGFT